MITQAELEHEMVDGGRAAATARFKTAEEAHDASSNPYAAAIFRRYIQPFANGLTAFFEKKTRGFAGKSKVLIREMDPLTLAYITIRGVLNETQHAGDDPTMNGMSMSVGRTVYSEVVLGHFKDINPELYFTLVQDLERRMTKSERHRFLVMKNSAEKDGIKLPYWDVATKAGVGALLVGCAVDIGLVESYTQRAGKKLTTALRLAPELQELIDQIKGYVAGLSPQVTPCVEPPKPWVSPTDGGWHTAAMRRTLPSCVRGVSRLSLDECPPIVLRGLNKLQAVSWRVNERVLEVAQIARTRFDVQDVLISDRRDELPDKPLFMQENPDLKPSEMSEMQKVEFKEWCGLAREYHTAQKLRGIHSRSTNESLRAGERFKGRPLWFVYSADYRGRFYASGMGINPQGNDLAKALLEFDRGHKILTERGAFWFRVAGANKWAQDKLDKQPLDVRAQWVIDNEQFIRAIAADPISNREWTGADVPFQFLAWCFDYTAWLDDPANHESRIPLGQDGSCNGLQHFSAMLRDSVGGRATNLVPDSVQRDIYGMVAQETAEIVQGDPDVGTIAERWKRHELSRSLVKRSVMTLPYGSNRRSCAEFILKEYLDKGSAPEFEKHERYAAAQWLSYRVWAGIGRVVVKGREAMEYLQEASKILGHGKLPHITWRTPSGFVVRQRYHAREVIRISCDSLSGKRIQVNIQTFRNEGDPLRHRNGTAPNFVHGCDASHMHLFLDAADAEGLDDLALIHDDYGCPADQVDTLHRLLRETFVCMYTDLNPLELLCEQYPQLPPPPDAGDLDLEVVKQSAYFFC